MTVHSPVTRYLQISLVVEPHVRQSSLCRLDTGSHPNIIAKPYISSHSLAFIEKKSSTPLTSATKDHILILRRLEFHIMI